MSEGTEEKKFAQIIVERDGDRDLVFDGILIGEGDRSNADGNRGTTIRIYRTAGGNYVVSTERWSIPERRDDTHEAAVCQTADGVYAQLHLGYLSPIAKEALREAATNDEAIDQILFEEVG